ncbi:MAG: 1,4-alpha-glucan branching protein GlgB, partial [Mogibacterium sp.]|nr:1,4-alpha-glucan branching protein GlgB [Mogibacterium sp.]
MTVKKDIAEHKYLFHHGRNYRSYELFGAHRQEQGYLFRVWAPRAVSVAVIGDFNSWDLNRHPMKQFEDDESIWEVLCPEAAEGDLYKYVVETDSGDLLYKADPYAFASESVWDEGSQRASRIVDLEERYVWGDAEWLDVRNHRNPYQTPMNIYEVHAGSWKHREDGTCWNYRELADRLIPYVKEMGYTHIELLPVMEHPFDGSWGYQVTGLYSVTSRYGTPDDFRYLIDLAHRNGIGVILDWVPAHFPKDAYGLIEFDGYPLYEYSDPLKMEHKGWGTRAFDFGRPEVISYLVSNAFYYCEQFHADGLRVDAVAAMLYLNYDRPDGEWTPNEDGGVENKEAIRFLQTLNQDVLTVFPGVLIMAEESTAWPNVTMPPSIGGLGFNFKWNMGWMNDVLDYFGTDPLYRSYVHHKLTFAITYAYSENFILPISHDEVVHGKRSLLDKMPGVYEDKFAGLRSFLLYMYTHPGKKLSFMGNELGQFIEWDEKRELDWLLLDYDQHRKTREFVKAVNHCYLDHPQLWKGDNMPEGFTWIEPDCISDNMYAYYREVPGEEGSVIVTILNLSGQDYTGYEIGVPEADLYRILLDSDAEEFGGTGKRTELEYVVREGKRNRCDHFIRMDLPKLSGVVLESYRFPTRRKRSSGTGKKSGTGAAKKS